MSTQNSAEYCAKILKFLFCIELYLLYKYILVSCKYIFIMHILYKSIYTKYYILLLCICTIIQEMKSIYRIYMYDVACIYFT